MQRSNACWNEWVVYPSIDQWAQAARNKRYTPETNISRSRVFMVLPDSPRAYFEQAEFIHTARASSSNRRQPWTSYRWLPDDVIIYAWSILATVASAAAAVAAAACKPLRLLGAPTKTVP